MLRGQILRVLATHTHTHTHTLTKELCEVMDVFISLIVVILKKKNTLGKLKKFIEIFGQLTRGNPSASMTKIKEREKIKQERQENYKFTQEVQNLRNRSIE